MSDRVVLRPASIADQATLERWDEDALVAESGGDDDVEDWAAELPRVLPFRWWFIAELSGVPIGCVQIIDPKEEETHYWGECEANLRAIDIWIGEPEMRGKGLGRQMMELAIKFCFSDPQVTDILIDPLASNEAAIRFYRKLGFEDVGPRRFGDDDCLVLKRSRGPGE